MIEILTEYAVRTLAFLAGILVLVVSVVNIRNVFTKIGTDKEK
jgi:hypothetical protein